MAEPFRPSNPVVTPWLHRVVMDLARMRHRSATRRAAREQAIVTSSVATPDQLVEKVEAQRALADEVLGLREPYRSTILLHYVEGLSSAEIARQLGIPSATVRQRLKHALDELRDRLQKREHAPKQGWLLALVPIAQVNSNMLPDEVGMLISGKGPGSTVSLKLARGVTIRAPVPNN